MYSMVEERPEQRNAGGWGRSLTSLGLVLLVPLPTPALKTHYRYIRSD